VATSAATFLHHHLLPLLLLAAWLAVVSSPALATAAAGCELAGPLLLLLLLLLLSTSAVVVMRGVAAVAAAAACRVLTLPAGRARNRVSAPSPSQQRCSNGCQLLHTGSKGGGLLLPLLLLLVVITTAGCSHSSQWGWLSEPLFAAAWTLPCAPGAALMDDCCWHVGRYSCTLLLPSRLLVRLPDAALVVRRPDGVWLRVVLVGSRDMPGTRVE
jgi:hypothetical protein